MAANIPIFQVLDLDNWTRYEYFTNYIENDHNIISFAVKLDISRFYNHIKQHDLRFFASLVSIISIIVNKHNEFKIAYNENNELGMYTSLNPSYTIFHDDDKSFSCVHSHFTYDCAELYQKIVQDIEQHKLIKGFEPSKAPKNSFPVTCIPWISYSSFCIIEHGKKENFFPFIIIGKYERDDIQVTLPITFQINHAVADAYHISCFFTELQDALNQCDQYIN